MDSTSRNRSERLKSVLAATVLWLLPSPSSLAQEQRSQELEGRTTPSDVGSPEPSKANPWIVRSQEPTNSFRLQSFSLTDQFGKTNQHNFPRKSPVLLVIADPRASRKLRDWTLPLGEKYSGRLEILAIADLKEVPENFRKMALSSIQEKRRENVLLDWSGTLTTPLKCSPRLPNLVLINTNGAVMLHVASNPAKPLITEFLSAMEANLGKAP